jgi:hypothetical protein
MTVKSGVVVNAVNVLVPAFCINVRQRCGQRSRRRYRPALPSALLVRVVVGVTSFIKLAFRQHVLSLVLSQRSRNDFNAFASTFSSAICRCVLVNVLVNVCRPARFVSV